VYTDADYLTCLSDFRRIDGCGSDDLPDSLQGLSVDEQTAALEDLLATFAELQSDVSDPAQSALVRSHIADLHRALDLKPSEPQLERPLSEVTDMHRFFNDAHSHAEQVSETRRIHTLSELSDGLRAWRRKMAELHGLPPKPTEPKK